MACVDAPRLPWGFCILPLPVHLDTFIHPGKEQQLFLILVQAFLQVSVVLFYVRLLLLCQSRRVSPFLSQAFHQQLVFCFCFLLLCLLSLSLPPPFGVFFPALSGCYKPVPFYTFAITGQ